MSNRFWLGLALPLFMASTGALRAEEQGSTMPVVERAVHVCNACHGEGGNSKATVFPKLAGQSPIYLAEQLRAFRSQKRSDSSAQAYMWGISALLDDPTIDGIAAYYAAQPPAPGKAGNAALTAQGEKIFREGIPASNIMACAKCHGENAEGASVFPRLAGQHSDYIVKQLHEFKTKLRPHSVMADRVVKDISPDQMQAVATYLQSR